MPVSRAKGKTMKVDWDEVERNKTNKNRKRNPLPSRPATAQKKKRLPTKPIKVNNA